MTSSYEREEQKYVAEEKVCSKGKCEPDFVYCKNSVSGLRKSIDMSCHVMSYEDEDIIKVLYFNLIKKE